ncbi:hypothetical protein ACHAWC_007659 [Mediolabrus comicus]
MAGQSRGKGKALNTIAARSGRDPAAIVDSIQAAEKAQAKAAAAAAKKAAVKKSEEEAAAAAAAKRKAEQEEETETTTTAIDNEVNNNITPAQIYSSLSPQEQYRYECFRRSGFASKPIEKFVANILIDEANKRFVSRRGTISGLGGRFNNNHHGKDNYYDGVVGGANAATVTDSSDVDNTHSKRKKKQSKKQMLRDESKRRRIAMDHPPPYLLPESNSGSGSALKAGSIVPPLDQLVVPSSAPEIVAVISTLAKSYAQRLVSAARRVADAENEQQKCLDESSTKEETASSSATTATATATPISPHHLLEAHRYRSRVGLDPGFWMADRVDVDGSSRKGSSSIQRASSSVGTSEAAALGVEDRTRSCFLAALAAQDAYDKVTTSTNGVEKIEDKMDVDKK